MFITNQIYLTLNLPYSSLEHSTYPLTCLTAVQLEAEMHRYDEQPWINISVTRKLSWKHIW